MPARSLASLPKPVDELFVQNEAVSLCLLVNRRAKTMRIVDFRAGATETKRQFVRSLAQREEMEKIYTLVERDELQTWVKLGFAKEGTIPGFYKRSDAFLLGCMVSALPVSPRRRRGDVPFESETRMVAAPAAPASAPPSPHDLSERTLASAKRAARSYSDKAVPQARIAALQESEARRAVAAAQRSGRALTAFEPFGRDVERRYFLAVARGGFELVASAESQACFGNAFLEVLQSPRTEPEALATAGSLRALCDRLVSDGVVSCFSLGPSDDGALAAAFVHAGFRRTGLLVGHLLAGGVRKDAILWSQKFAAANDEER